MSHKYWLGVLLLLCVAQFALPRTIIAETFDDSAIKHIDYPDWFADLPFLDLRGELSDARETGKRGMMVLFTTEGCSYCDAFIERSLADPQIAGELQQHFSSVGLEIFDDAEMTAPNGEALPVKAFAKRNGAAFSPTIVFFANDGDPVLRLVGYQSPERFRQVLSYVRDERYRDESLPEFLNRASGESTDQRTRGDLIADPLFSEPPHYLDRTRMAAQRPLLVIFARAGCRGCEVFQQEVMVDEGVRDRLHHFEIVRLDAGGDTSVVRPDGRRSSAAAWFEEKAFTRLPALMFFDEGGHLVLETDALVLNQRMLNALDYVLERAYEKGWTYQRFARQRGAERMRERSAAQ